MHTQLQDQSAQEELYVRALTAHPHLLLTPIMEIAPPYLLPPAVPGTDTSGLDGAGVKGTCVCFISPYLKKKN